jgi:hypothetical protein
MMCSHRRTHVLLLAAVVAAQPTCCCVWALPQPAPDPICLQAPYQNPPSDFQENDLVGTWQAHYGQSVDMLVLSGDGSFQQVYQDGHADNYVYETAWNDYDLERFADGRVRVHLQGARYYAQGTSIAENEGLQPEPWPGFYGESGPPAYLFYDPFAEQPVFMVRELVLNVRVDSSGELLLYHMDIESDGGFAQTGCQRRIFRRVDTR